MSVTDSTDTGDSAASNSQARTSGSIIAVCGAGGSIRRNGPVRGQQPSRRLCGTGNDAWKRKRRALVGASRDRSI